MNVLDVNVVVALGRGDHPHHSVARAWWDAASPDDGFVIPDVVAAAFVRLVTGRRLFADPSTPAEAFAFLGSLRAMPGHVPVTRDVIDHFEQVCVEAGARGDLANDAYIAAVAVALGGTVITFDRDFRRFDGVRVQELPTT